MSIPLDDSLSDPKFFKGTFMSYQIDPADAQFSPNAEYLLSHAEYHDMKIKPDRRLTYKMNNYAHRCDDFNKLDPNKTNILFAGCSITFGDALPAEYRWSEFLYNELEIENKGPYHSLGFLGGGADKIVMNILKYCKEFGNPDILFILYSDFTREVKFIEDSGQFRSMIDIDYSTRPISLKSEELAYQKFLHTQNYIRMLEVYCELNNIKLITSCWDGKTSTELSKLDLKYFYEMKPVDEDRIDIDWVPKHDRKYLIRARDNHHDGIINNLRMKDFFLNIYKESIGIGVSHGHTIDSGSS